MGNKQLITFDDYIKNPMSRDNAVFSHREMYANLYRDKLNTIMVRENGKVEYFLYTDKRVGRYYVHLKIPSEVVPRFHYDVVIEFSPSNPTSGVSRSIKDYNVRFYSNDPSFVFTFAHAFMTNGLFLDDLKSKMSKEAIKDVAKEKNPSNQVGYVKSLYFAYLMMKDRSLFDKIKFESEANNFDLRILLSKIEDADIKIAKRQQEAQELSKKKKIEKKKEDTNEGRRNNAINQKFREKRDNVGLSIGNTRTTAGPNQKNVKQSKSSSKVSKVSKGVSKIKKF